MKTALEEFYARCDIDGSAVDFAALSKRYRTKKDQGNLDATLNKKYGKSLLGHVASADVEQPRERTRTQNPLDVLSNDDPDDDGASAVTPLQFLEQLRLTAFHDALVELGAQEPSDLAEVDDADIATLGMPKLHANRLAKAIKQQ